MYLGRRDREVVYIYIPISFDAEISWRRTYSDNESTSPQKKKFLVQGFKSVSRFTCTFFFFSFFLRAAETLRFALLGFWKEMERLGGAFGFGIMWKTGRCDSGRSCVLLHARLRSLWLQKMLCGLFGGVCKKGFGFLGV